MKIKRYRKLTIATRRRTVFYNDCLNNLIIENMTCFFITRHLGALAWAAQVGFAFDVHQTHLDNINHYHAGDVVAGTLPINIVANLLEQGASYLHLSLEIPPHLRGVELTMQQLNDCNARLEEFTVLRTFFTNINPP